MCFLTAHFNIEWLLEQLNTFQSNFQPTQFCSKFFPTVLLTKESQLKTHFYLIKTIKILLQKMRWQWFSKRRLRPHGGQLVGIKGIKKLKNQQPPKKNH